MARIRVGAAETTHGRSTLRSGLLTADMSTLRGGTLLAVAAVTAAVIAGAAAAMICGPVWAPITAGAAAFVSGGAIASVYWHAWTGDRVERALQDPLTG